MEKKVISKPICNRFKIEQCHAPESKLSMGEDKACSLFTPISCPHLLCNGCVCKFGSKVDTTKDKIIFPCDECDGMPSADTIAEESKKLINEGVGVWNGTTKA